MLRFIPLVAFTVRTLGLVPIALHAINARPARSWPLVILGRTALLVARFLPLRSFLSCILYVLLLPF